MEIPLIGQAEIMLISVAAQAFQLGGSHEQMLRFIQNTALV